MNKAPDARYERRTGGILITQTQDSLVAGPNCRQPRIGMTVNGVQVGGLKSFTAIGSNYFTCDRWSATIGLQGAPSGYGAAFWSIESGVEVGLMASLASGGGLVPVTGGVCDRVEIKIATQEMIIEGRDYCAALIDHTTNEKFTSQTSSQVATTLATRRNLVPQVTATTTPVGRIVSGQYDHVSDDVSEWRLLSYLAQQEGFNLYCVGRTLVFGPPVVDMNPLVITYQYSDPAEPSIRANAPDFTLMQNKVLAGVVTVQVRSWNYQQGKPVIATWESQKTQKATQPGHIAYQNPSPKMTYTRAQKQGGQGVDGPFYVVRRTGLTQQQADALAQKTLADITNNERSLEVTGLPAILGVDARRTLRLAGTGTAFDQDYEIGEITRTFGWPAGATMDIHAKSSSPQTLVTI
jgi:phage protein D